MITYKTLLFDDFFFFFSFLLAFTFLFLTVNEVNQRPNHPHPLFPRAKIFSFEFFDAQINLYIGRT
jgi:hypothetical protein